MLTTVMHQRKRYASLWLRFPYKLFKLILITYFGLQSANRITGCPAGPTMLRASVDVMLKHQISTLSPAHIFQTIVFKIGVGDYVMGSTKTAKYDPDMISGGGPTRWCYMQVL